MKKKNEILECERLKRLEDRIEDLENHVNPKDSCPIKKYEQVDITGEINWKFSMRHDWLMGYHSSSDRAIVLIGKDGVEMNLLDATADEYEISRREIRYSEHDGFRIFHKQQV